MDVLFYFILFEKGGTHGSFTKTSPWIDTNACNRDDLVALQISFLSPVHVPRIDKHTFPSS